MLSFLLFLVLFEKGYMVYNAQECFQNEKLIGTDFLHIFNKNRPVVAHPKFKRPTFLSIDICDQLNLHAFEQGFQTYILCFEKLFIFLRCVAIDENWNKLIFFSIVSSVQQNKCMNKLKQMQIQFFFGQFFYGACCLTLKDMNPLILIKPFSCQISISYNLRMLTFSILLHIHLFLSINTQSVFNFPKGQLQTFKLILLCTSFLYLLIVCGFSEIFLKQNFLLGSQLWVTALFKVLEELFKTLFGEMSSRHKQIFHFLCILSHHLCCLSFLLFVRHLDALQGLSYLFLVKFLRAEEIVRAEVRNTAVVFMAARAAILTLLAANNAWRQTGRQIGLASFY